jgi:predicted negative regulator of RcsB-dependent stress response
MSHYEDEAQVVLLKQWWNENWKALAAGLILGLGGIFGWQEWQNHKNKVAEQASQIFDDLKKTAPDKGADLADKLQQDFGGTPYAAQAALLMAQRLADKNDWTGAQARLEWVAKNAGDRGLVKIAKLRLARVLWQQRQPEQALAQLEIKDDDPFASLYQDLRGDIKLAQGDKAAARAAYRKALDLGPAAAAREFIQRKLDDLPAPAADKPADKPAGKPADKPAEKS